MKFSHYKAEVIKLPSNYEGERRTVADEVQV
jgi:hypothetical protein